MKKHSSTESLLFPGSPMIFAALAVAAFACAPSVPLENRPCPCADGWVCCPSGNVCVEKASSCSNGEAPSGTAGSTRPGLDGPSVGSTDGGTTTSGDALPPAPDRVYRLVQTRSLGSPLPDPTGIASDGSGFWILSGGQNSETNTLVHFNPDTGVTDRRFQFQGLIEMLGTGAYGITWDGSSVWISVSGNTNKLVRVDPSSGQITRTMSSPTDLGPSDLDFDGSNLWLSSGTGTVFVIDPVTGGIQRHFPTGPRSLGRDSGIAVRANEVWVGDLFGGMEVYDPQTGAVTATATHSDGSAFQQDEMGSSCFVGDELVMASHFGITYYRADLAP